MIPHSPLSVPANQWLSPAFLAFLALSNKSCPLHHCCLCLSLQGFLQHPLQLWSSCLEAQSAPAPLNQYFQSDLSTSRSDHVTLLNKASTGPSMCSMGRPFFSAQSNKSLIPRIPTSIISVPPNAPYEPIMSLYMVVSWNHCLFFLFLCSQPPSPFIPKDSVLIFFVKESAMRSL